MNNRRYAVMGNPIEHSLSPVIHQLFALQTGVTLTYEKLLVQSDSFEQDTARFFAEKGCGLNITLPFKTRAFSLANSVTQRCQDTKAANTLWQDENGLHADNTDGVGLLRDLANYIDIPGKYILLLGAGGAARGILAPLLATKPRKLTIANRTVEKAHALSNDFHPATSCDLSALNETYDLIINATSAGLSGHCLDLPKAIITSNTFCYDLAYNIKNPTPFVTWAQKQGCVAADGLGMLVEQAAEAFAVWHGVVPDVVPILHHLRLSS